jgi:hypothetical protein
MSSSGDPSDTFTVNSTDERVAELASRPPAQPPDELSIHDNLVYAWIVLPNQQQIHLLTEGGTAERREYTDVVFDGVIAHHFELARDENILDGIDWDWPSHIYAAYKDLFERAKAYRWPIEYRNEQELFEKLRQQGIEGFWIRAHWGLCGWVLARAFKLDPQEKRHGRDVLPNLG